MVQFGYALSSEEHPPSALVRNARRAEDLGFDFLSVSDHYHPWVDAQGNSPFVWSVLGAIAVTTERIRVGTGVTAPIMRIHPAVIAQAAATTAAMMPGRFFFGVGSGEALNEHITGEHWPQVDVRLEMLEESVEIIRELWKGDLFSHRGTHYTVENARLYTTPDAPPEIIVSGAGPKASELAGRIGDGYWGMAPDPELVQAYVRAGGSGPKYAQVTMCWAESEAEARKTVAQVWPNTGLQGQLAQELALPSYFESATATMTEEQISESVPCGPDAQPVLDAVKKYADAGYDHIYFHQVGPDQDGFFSFAETELLPALR